MDNKDATVLVVGATGLLGIPSARKLQRAGFKVRVIGRDMSRLERHFDASYDRMVADVTEPESVRRAVNGCYGIHFTMKSNDSEAAIVRDFVAAAKQARVERISYVSGTTVCEGNAWYPMVADKLAAEKCIADSGLGYALFRPTWFFDVLENLVRGGRAVMFGTQPKPYRLVSSEDFAALVARSYEVENAPNRAFQVLGPERLLMRDALLRYCAVLHPEITKVTAMPFWVARVIATLRGAKGREMKWATGFMEYFQNVGEGTPTAETDELLGKCPTTLDQWLDARREKNVGVSNSPNGSTLGK